MFRVGMKVECISNESDDGPNDPRKGDVATVSRVYVFMDGETCLELVEFPQPGNEETGSGYYARYFRPLQTKSTEAEVAKLKKRFETIKQGEDA